MEQPKIETKPKETFSERIRDLWRNLNISIKSSLKIMKTTDYGKNGLNEAGFKGIVLATLIPLLNKEKEESVHSEVKVEGGYCDLVVIFPKFDTALIIELKYLQLLYFQKTKWQAIANAKTGQIERSLLEPFRKLKVEDLDTLIYRNPKTNRYDSSITDCIREAQQQALDYAKSLRDGGLMPFNPKPKIVYYGIIIGCACTTAFAIKKL